MRRALTVDERFADMVAHALLHRLADWPEGTLEGHDTIRTGPAARILGVSENTLRSWERRYGFPIPVRNTTAYRGGQRQYVAAQILLLKEAMDRAGEISAALALLHADIEAYRDGAQ